MCFFLIIWEGYNNLCNYAYRFLGLLFTRWAFSSFLDLANRTMSVVCGCLDCHARWNGDDLRQSIGTRRTHSMLAFESWSSGVVVIWMRCSFRLNVYVLMPCTYGQIQTLILTFRMRVMVLFWERCFVTCSLRECVIRVLYESWLFCLSLDVNLWNSPSLHVSVSLCRFFRYVGRVLITERFNRYGEFSLLEERTYSSMNHSFIHID